MRKKRYTKMVGVLLTEEYYEKLIRVTDQQECPLSLFARKVIEDKLDQIQEGEPS